MRGETRKRLGVGTLAVLIMVPGMAYAQEPSKSSYSPVVIKEPFADIEKRMKSAKP